MKKIIFLFTALFLLGCTSAEVENKKISRITTLEEKEKFTQEYLKKYNNTITLENALSISLDRNLKLKTKEIEKEIARIDKNIAFGNFLPKISLSYSHTLLNDTIKGEALDTGMDKLIGMPINLEARLLDKDFSLFNVNAQLPIFVPSTWFLYSAREKGENISKLTKDLTEKMIKLQTVGEYYYILALESERAYLKKEVEYSEQLKKNSQLALKTQSILPWEAESVEVLYEIKKLGLEQNKRDLESAKINFLNTLNLYPFTNIKLIKPLDNEKTIPTLDEAIYQALLSSDIISIREETQEISKDVKKIAISNFLPKIVLTGGYINTSNEALADPDFFMGTLGGFFSIFNGFQNINQYKKAREQEKIAYIKREEEISKVIFETVNAYNNLQRSIEEKDIAFKNFKAMEGMIHQKQLEYKTGIIEDWEYMKYLADFEKALSLKEKAQFKYQMSKATLDMLTGTSIFAKGEIENEKK